MPRLEPELAQLARPIPRRVIAQNPAKQEKLECARGTIRRTEDARCSGVEEAYFFDGHG